MVRCAVNRPVEQRLPADNSAAGIQDKIDDYLAFGIPCV